jgi:hypothetical protein
MQGFSRYFGRSAAGSFYIDRDDKKRNKPHQAAYFFQKPKTSLINTDCYTNQSSAHRVMRIKHRI